MFLPPRVIINGAGDGAITFMRMKKDQEIWDLCEQWISSLPCWPLQSKLGWGLSYFHWYIRSLKKSADRAKDHVMASTGFIPVALKNHTSPNSAVNSSRKTIEAKFYAKDRYIGSKRLPNCLNGFRRFSLKINKYIGCVWIWMNWGWKLFK